ncbi:DUF6283 family protein [Duganella sp. FT27W]|uniref:DUF6283 family protein n=1 Tax=Duganella sp. FT27W TaxID=2654636 RepID=UPI00128BF9D2|nr:DUF6283 family protein [Duganella sp. FT27W]MPQ56246.1 hypothetical protein [Duganella sp. FT27W]
MSDTCKMNVAGGPCPSCPWRTDQTAADIPNFDLEKAEGLAKTCPNERGFGPDFDASLFACHKSKEGAEIACAGWLAAVGGRHPQVRLAVMRGQLDPERLAPGKAWPELHDNYQDVLRKLRQTA